MKRSKAAEPERRATSLAEGVIFGGTTVALTCWVSSSSPSVVPAILGSIVACLVLWWATRSAPTIARGIPTILAAIVGGIVGLILRGPDVKPEGLSFASDFAAMLASTASDAWFRAAIAGAGLNYLYTGWISERGALPGGRSSPMAKGLSMVIFTWFTFAYVNNSILSRHVYRSTFGESQLARVYDAESNYFDTTQTYTAVLSELRLTPTYRQRGLSMQTYIEQADSLGWSARAEPDRENWVCTVVVKGKADFKPTCTENRRWFASYGGTPIVQIVIGDSVNPGRERGIGVWVAPANNKLSHLAIPIVMASADSDIAVPIAHGDEWAMLPKRSGTTMVYATVNWNGKTLTDSAAFTVRTLTPADSDVLTTDIWRPVWDDMLTATVWIDSVRVQRLPDGTFAVRLQKQWHRSPPKDHNIEHARAILHCNPALFRIIEVSDYLGNKNIVATRAGPDAAPNARWRAAENPGTAETGWAERACALVGQH